MLKQQQRNFPPAREQHLERFAPFVLVAPCYIPCLCIVRRGRLHGAPEKRNKAWVEVEQCNELLQPDSIENAKVSSHRIDLTNNQSVDKGTTRAH
jgi:hypothetical protein